MAAAAAIRAANCISAAACHLLSSSLRRFAPRSARRDFVGGITPTAAFTRPLLPHAQLGPRVLRRGLAMIQGDPSLGAEAEIPDPYDPFDPDSPDDPETCFAYDEKDLESEEAMWAMYERWRVFYGVKRDHEDMVQRFGYFKDYARWVHEFNQSGKPYTLGLKYADHTPEEHARFLRPRFWRLEPEKYI